MGIEIGNRDYRISREELHRIRKSCVVQGIGMPIEEIMKHKGLLHIPDKPYSVPFSEIAIHLKAAGGRIIALSCSLGEGRKPKACSVIFEAKDGTCGTIGSPIPGEIIPIELRKELGIWDNTKEVR